MKTKATLRKIKSTTQKVSRKTKVLVKTAGAKASEMTKNLQQEWKKEQPQRDALARSARAALGRGIKIGGDVYKTIANDVREIKHKNRKK